MSESVASSALPSKPPQVNISCFSDKSAKNILYFRDKSLSLQLKINRLWITQVGDNEHPRWYEIDFLISRQNKICPIEVKSSGYKSHKSLDEFQQKYSSRIQQRYLLYTKDLRKEQDIICLPIYMTGLL